jgi:CheY-like chemotaxis protein
VPYRILLVDDDIAEISAVKRLLLRAGHDLVLATNTSDAMALVESHPPDLALVASACENGDGAALAKKLASEEATSGIPLALIGDAAVEGAPALTQPIDADALEGALEKLLSRPRPPPPPRPMIAQSTADALRARADELRRSPGFPAQVPPPVPAAPPSAPAPKAAARPPNPRPPPPSPPATVPAAAPAAPQSTADLARAWFEGEGAVSTAPAPLAEGDFAEADQLLKALQDLQRTEDPNLEAAPTRTPLRTPVPSRTPVPAAAEPKPAPRPPEPPPSRPRPARSLDDEMPSSLRLELDAEAEALRRRLEEESRRRAEAEAELARLDERRKRAEADREAALADSRRAAEDAEVHRAAVAEAARKRVLEVAKARHAPAAAPRPEAPPVNAPPPELLEGSLGQTSLPRLLALASRGRTTGRLEIAGGAPRALWIELGRVVGARSGCPGERPEDVALRLGLITREQHRQAGPAASGLASRRVGVLLLDRGFLKSTELAPLARHSAEEILFACFASDAPYRFHAGERVPPDERTALERGTIALAVEGVRRRWTAAQLDAVLGGAGTLLAPAANPPPWAELGLSREEMQLAELADGLRTLDEILADVPGDPLLARQALAAMVEVGTLEVRVREAPSDPAVSSSSSIDLARVDEKLDLVRRADYFAILGLARACTPYEIRAASERLLAELAPERFAGAEEGELASKLDEIRHVIAEARDILLDDGLRTEYVAALGG